MSELQKEIARQKAIIEKARDWSIYPKFPKFVVNDELLNEALEFAHESRTAWPRVLEALEVATSYLSASYCDDLHCGSEWGDVRLQCPKCQTERQIQKILNGEHDD